MLNLDKETTKYIDFERNNEIQKPVLPTGICKERDAQNRALKFINFRKLKMEALKRFVFYDTDK